MSRGREDNGGGHRRAPGAARTDGPSGRLDALGRAAAAREEDTRAEVCRAALAAAGELGWGHLTVDAIASRAGLSRARFYRLFADKDECLGEAYARAAEELLEGVLHDLEEAPDRREGLRRALGRLTRLVGSEPLLARGLLAEARLAGGEVSAGRQEVFGRLSRAFPDARRETAKPRHPSPPFAAPFILAAIDSALVEATARNAPRPLAGRIDPLTELACRAYSAAAGVCAQA